MKPRAALALAALVALLPAAARAHEVEVEVDRRGPEIAVRARYHGGRALADALYEVGSPAAPGRAHDEGRTDRHGWLVFVPDAPGRWTVRIVDASGHGKVQEIDVPADAVARAGPAGSPPGADAAARATERGGAARSAAARAEVPVPPIARETAAESAAEASRIYRVIGGFSAIALVFVVLFAVALRRRNAGR